MKHLPNTLPGEWGHPSLRIISAGCSGNGMKEGIERGWIACESTLGEEDSGLAKEGGAGKSMALMYQGRQTTLSISSLV